VTNHYADEWVHLSASVAAQGGVEEEDQDEDEAISLTQLPASQPIGRVSPWFPGQSLARNIVDNAAGRPAKQLLPAPSIDRNHPTPFQRLKSVGSVQRQVTWVAEDPAKPGISSDRSLIGDIGRPPGRRHGPLKETVRENAKEVRRRKACIPCARNNSRVGILNRLL
jgi:hypothetical protein